MSTRKEQKITKLLDQHKPGTVSLAPWLERLGISRDLQKRYRRSGWLESVGKGAFRRRADEVQWQGGLYALQTQAALPVHVGAMTALAMQGLAHYLRLGKTKVFLFSPPKTPSPAWFRNHPWDVSINHVQTSILPESLGLADHEEKMFAIRISAAERAVLECFYLAPDELDLVECFQVMEGLANLRPKLVQELLQACTSVKANRLFLYMAEKAGHQWFDLVDTKKVNLGDGHRRLAENGVYVAKYKLTVPKALAAL
jgi:hypothetical protein